MTTDGTQFNPQAGKTATTAVLQAKAADVLLNFKLDARNLYLYQLGMKKIWMNQQMADMEKDWEIQQQHFGSQLNDLMKPDGEGDQDQGQGQNFPWAMTDVAGKISAVKLNPSEIQEDFECEPEAGSYMAVDDDLRRQAAVELDQIALSAPDVLDRQKVVVNHMKSIKGIDNPEEFLAAPKSDRKSGV